MSDTGSAVPGAPHDDDSCEIQVRVDSFVGTLLLNRPKKHNAISDSLYDSMCREFVHLTENPDVRVIVLEGAGPSFSAGRDTSEMGRNVAGGGGLAHAPRSQQMNKLIGACPKPVVAALHGYVLGKALEMALAADFRIAATDTKLGFPEIKFGLVTDNAGAAQATIAAGPSRAKYLIMSGDPIDAETARNWGLVDWVVAADDLGDFTLHLTQRLAERSPLALQAAKDIVDQVHQQAVAAGFRNEMLSQLVLFASQGASNRDR